MQNFYKLSISAILAGLFYTSLAQANSEANYYDLPPQQPPSYYEDEGALLFKIRGSFAHTKAKLNKLPEIDNDLPAPKSLIGKGYGIEAAVNYFVANNIAIELAAGLQTYKLNKSDMTKLVAKYGDGTADKNKHNQIYFLPITATLQFHVAPFGAVRPYVGGGYHAAYSYTRSKQLRVASTHGAVLQAGIDFMSKENWIFNIDVKQYFTDAKVTFHKELLTKEGANIETIKAKTKLNPLVISAGIGFKF